MSVDTTSDTGVSVEELFRHELRGRWSDSFSAEQATWMARTALPLDCMGGFAEYCGALTLTLPTTEAVYAAAQPRTDQCIQLHLRTGHPKNGELTSVTLPLALWYEGPAPVGAAEFVRRLEQNGAAWAKPLAGPLHTLLAGGRVPHLGGGLTLAAMGDEAWEQCSARAAALSAAALAAVCPSVGLRLKPAELASLCCGHQNQILGFPCGPSEAAAALLGRSRALLQVLCQPMTIVGQLALPDGVTLLGIDSGTRHPQADWKYRQARTAAFMGRCIIERLFAARGHHPDWEGYLARLSVSEYVKTLRDRLPTKMRGKDFLERFGDPGDGLTRLDESAVYKIRSRTEHHIYENARVHQFVEHFAESGQTGAADWLRAAGELMFASHWSYGQRCGLGSIETDRLVNGLRRRGVQAGIFGAKVCGAGAGGTVAVLLQDTETARRNVSEAVAEYAQDTGHTTRLLTALSDGAPACDIQQIA